MPYPRGVSATGTFCTGDIGCPGVRGRMLGPGPACTAGVRGPSPGAQATGGQNGGDVVEKGGPGGWPAASRCCGMLSTSGFLGMRFPWPRPWTSRQQHRPVFDQACKGGGRAAVCDPAPGDGKDMSGAWRSNRGFQRFSKETLKGSIAQIYLPGIMLQLPYKAPGRGGMQQGSWLKPSYDLSVALSRSGLRNRSSASAAPGTNTSA